MRWRLADRTLDLAQPLAAGIVDIGGDSACEGACGGTPEQAVADGMALAEAGFDMLHLGSAAAPGSAGATETAAPVAALEGLGGCGLPLSADAFSADAARQALAAGAVAVNDLSAGGAAMLELVADSGCGYVLVAGRSQADQPRREFGDVIDELKAWFEVEVELARGLGVAEEQIAIDPGVGLDPRAGRDLEVLRRLGELRALELPLCLSLSRAEFIGAVLAGSEEARLPAEEREWGAAGAVALAVRGGADVLRVHDLSSLQAIRVAARILRPARI